MESIFLTFMHKTLFDFYAQNSFLLLCTKRKAKIKVESPKGYKQIGVKILSNFDMEFIFLIFMHKN
jgi:hypothetical protein